MSGDPQNYRPRSPDLSAYSPQPPPRLSHTQFSAYPPPPIPQHRGSYDASPYFSPQTTSNPQSYFASQPHAPPQILDYQRAQFYNPQQPFHPHAPPSAHNFQYSSFSNTQEPLIKYDPDMPRRRKSDDMDQRLPDAPAYGSGMKNIKSEMDLHSVPAHSGPSQGIEVKTKFPVARIKRIMQADEDVGKVAQATPTAVSKALELFMITLVTKAATEAKEKSSKRITASHLKAAVAKDDVLDFLNDIIEKVPDAPEKGKARARSDSPDGTDEGSKKKRAPRRKKSEVDD